MKIKLLVTGDFCPIGRNKQYIVSGDYNKLFSEFIEEAKTVDLAIANLECPTTEVSTKIEKSGPNIKTTPKVPELLSKAGFGLVTLANNHIMDFGSKGLKDTILACKRNGVDTVGAGRNIGEARKPYYWEKNGVTFAIINIAENEFCTTSGDYYGANPLNVITNHYDIAEAKKNADYVIVISHGGREHYQLPTPQLRERYRFFIESGADIVIGHHTHTYSGHEEYKGKNIFYSLGNFIFDYKKKYQKGTWTQGYAVKLIFENGDINFELIPYNQGRADNHQITTLNDRELVIFNEKIEELNNTIINDELFSQKWEEYISSQEKSYKSNLFIQNKYQRALISKGLIPPMYMHSKEHKKVLLNLLRCESHREIIIDILKKDYVENN